MIDLSNLDLFHPQIITLIIMDDSLFPLEKQRLNLFLKSQFIKTTKKLTSIQVLLSQLVSGSVFYSFKSLLFFTFDSLYSAPVKLLNEVFNRLIFAC